MGLVGLAALHLMAAELANGAPNAEKLGWHLGCQTWTFREFSLFEAIDKTAALGMHYMETGAGMKSLSKEQPQLKFTEDSPAAIRSAVKKKLADTGMTAEKLRRYPAIQGRGPMPQDVQLRQGHGHGNDRFRARRRRVRHDREVLRRVWH